MAEIVAVSNLRLKSTTNDGPFLLRVFWFFVLGWELAGIWIVLAWIFNATIIGLPVGLWMIDQVPQVLTLKSRPGVWVIDTDKGRSKFVGVSQFSWIVRGLYFLLIGWWLSLFWSLAAWLICATIIGLPIGVLMLHALPAVTTLQRG